MLLTDRAQSGVEALGPYFVFGVYVFLAYALAQHVGWVDGAAITLAFGQLNRAIGSVLARKEGQ